LSEKRDEEEFCLCEQELVESMEAAVNGDIDLLYQPFQNVIKTAIILQYNLFPEKHPC
jgi:hypothetical protein